MCAIVVALSSVALDGDVMAMMAMEKINNIFGIFISKNNIKFIPSKIAQYRSDRILLF